MLLEKHTSTLPKSGKLFLVGLLLALAVIRVDLQVMTAERWLSSNHEVLSGGPPLRRLLRGSGFISTPFL
jgi:hypothetical protein